MYCVDLNNQSSLLLDQKVLIAIMHHPAGHNSSGMVSLLRGFPGPLVSMATGMMVAVKSEDGQTHKEHYKQY